MISVTAGDTRRGSGRHRITTALLAAGLCACEGRPTSPTGVATPSDTASLSARLHATVLLIDDDDTPVEGAAVDALLWLGDAPRTATARSGPDGVATIELAVSAVEADAPMATVSVRREGFETTRTLVTIGRSPGTAQEIRVLKQLRLSPNQSLDSRLFDAGPRCGIDELLCRVVHIAPPRSGRLTIAVTGDDDRLAVDLESFSWQSRRAPRLSLAVDAGAGITVAVLGEHDGRFTVTATYDR